MRTQACSQALVDSAMVWLMRFWIGAAEARARTADTTKSLVLIWTMAKRMASVCVEKGYARGSAGGWKVA